MRPKKTVQSRSNIIGRKARWNSWTLLAPANSLDNELLVMSYIYIYNGNELFIFYSFFVTDQQNEENNQPEAGYLQS